MDEAQRDPPVDPVPLDARRPFWRIALPLALAETIVWAAYFYAFPALLLVWEQDLGWSKTELSGAFTLALVTSALLAPVAGRQIDRGRAALVFAGSASVAAFLLAALSTVTALWHFYLIWIGLGAAMAGSLYEACFAVVTRTLGPEARRGSPRSFWSPACHRLLSERASARRLARMARRGSDVGGGRGADRVPLTSGLHRRRAPSGTGCAAGSLDLRRASSAWSAFPPSGASPCCSLRSQSIDGSSSPICCRSSPSAASPPRPRCSQRR
ncbi:MAG: MFS transporter [Alphaproteobacteria bacterium]